jgi:hypothetical protein
MERLSGKIRPPDVEEYSHEQLPSFISEHMKSRLEYYS